ncbi:hypothetical protein [Nitrosomonas ureae]|uniref:Uncharacterized protein n=1 Tax=Nitrosomonas ureae TaxID=44577 RepID=A0A0S3ALB5_9PROT|nr:hypothetical protein [Nitrosomonas ureae]ALQ51688.1 hypothetical protein ATY38_10930 [Nitrosomonas ureae]PTQ80932.1 hypothetical protein C8R28_103537 [Nitrosomonas ureae]PXX06483.1 hypothetical protein C8R27_1621 [Nitrosomonas ureae]SDU33387.1 hypothetical protein SAMN05216406_1572 [Nitrosomonas ureae]SEQ59100.1 hypothetical protein SAMN05421510_10958 [Nitrosomonas ureae]
MKLINSESVERTDELVGMVCYSMFNHLQRLANLYTPEFDFEAAIKIQENPFQLQAAAFFQNLRLAALENNFCTLLLYCYYESHDFYQFKRLTPYLTSRNHLLCNKILNPYHGIEDEIVLDFFTRFVIKFNRNLNFEHFIKAKVNVVMRTFKIHEEQITCLFPQRQPLATLH